MSATRSGLTGGICAASLLLPLLAGQGLAQPPAKAQQNVPQVAPIEVISAVPIPKVGDGAPLFTAEELKSASATARKQGVEAQSNSRRCSNGSSWARFNSAGPPTYASAFNEEFLAQMTLMTAAKRAADASTKALAVRVDAAAGAATQAQVETAELDRQAAVKRYINARYDAGEAGAVVTDLQRIEYDPTRRGNDIRNELAVMAAERYWEGGPEGIVIGRTVAGMAFSAVVVTEREDSRGRSLRITGRVRNSREGAMILPALSFTAVDEDGQALRTVNANPGRLVRIPAGGDVPFSYEFKPAPGRAQSVLVAFASDRQPPGRLPVGMFCSGF